MIYKTNLPKRQYVKLNVLMEIYFQIERKTLTLKNKKNKRDSENHSFLK